MQVESREKSRDVQLTVAVNPETFKQILNVQGYYQFSSRSYHLLGSSGMVQPTGGLKNESDSRSELRQNKLEFLRDVLRHSRA